MTVLKFISGPVGETCSEGSLHGTLFEELNERNQMGGLYFFVVLMVLEISFFCIFQQSLS